MNRDKPIIIYIASVGRSGSTLLDRLLGTIDGFQSCGETVELWRRVLNSEKRCTCGEIIRNCPFWKSVLRKVFTAASDDEISQFATLFYSTINKWLFVSQFIKARYFKAISYTINKLYHAIAETSKARVIVDSSKAPWYVYFLAKNINVDLRIVHLVRDSRGVVYSHMRKKRVPSIGYTRTANPFKIILAWDLYNAFFERLKYKYKYVRVNYEQLVANPQKTIICILKSLGLLEEMELTEDKCLSAFKDEYTIVLDRSHLVAGNIMRFQYGEIKIELDEYWRKKLPKFYKAVTTILTSPFLRKYGYCLSPSSCYSEIKSR